MGDMAFNKIKVEQVEGLIHSRMEALTVLRSHEHNAPIACIWIKNHRLHVYTNCTRGLYRSYLHTTVYESIKYRFQTAYMNLTLKVSTSSTSTQLLEEPRFEVVEFQVRNCHNGSYVITTRKTNISIRSAPHLVQVPTIWY